MKRLSFYFLFGFLVLACSCSIGDDGGEPADTSGVVEVSSSIDVPVTESTIIESECYITVPNITVPSRDSVNVTTLEYDIASISENYSFEDIIDVFLDKAEVDDYTLGESYIGDSEYTPVYFPDYSQVVDGFYLDPYYVPFDYELHTVRVFSLKNIAVSVTEYEDPEWAEIGFSGDYQRYDPTVYDFLNDDYENGYCFIWDSSFFRASYLLNDCVIVFNYSNYNFTAEEYQIYLDICEELGLPTCDEITEEIMG